MMQTPRLPGFRLLECLGQGASGTVYRAWQESPPRHVALKILPGASSVDDAERFLYEAEILAELDHANVARLWVAGLADMAGPEPAGKRVVPWLALEWVRRGRDILTFAEQERLGRDARISLFLQGLDAIRHGQELGVLHGDLKPEHLLVDERSSVKVIDWGLASRADIAERTSDAVGRWRGSVGYMAPELLAARGERITTTSELYSLGVILCELLTGRHPHRRTEDTESTLAVRVLDEEPTLPRQLPRDLRLILRQSLTRDPRHRYPTVAALEEDLEAFLARQPISARNGTATYHLRLLVQRQRARFALVGLLVLLAWGSVFLSREAIAEARNAESLANARRTELDRIRERAEAATRDLRDQRERLRLLSRSHQVDVLRERSQELVPVSPDRSPELRAWLVEADALEPLAPRLQELLAELNTEAESEPVALAKYAWVPPRRAGVHHLWRGVLDMRELVRIEERLLAVHAQEPLPDFEPVVSQREIEQHRAMERRMHDQLAQTVSLPSLPARTPWSAPQRTWFLRALRERAHVLAAFLKHEPTPDGLFDRDRPGMRHRAFLAAEMDRATREPSFLQSWTATLSALHADERFRGALQAPIPGFVPVGTDPDSGLYEFAFLPTGRVPERDDAGVLRPAEDTALVFVLLPGGRTTIGASLDPDSPHHDPRAREGLEVPPQDVDLAPFLISKYELTWGQFVRLCGGGIPFDGRLQKNRYTPPSRLGGVSVTPRHPLESISWLFANTLLERVQLHLPTEAQWEYAARGGIDTLPVATRETANVADQALRRVERRMRAEEFAPWDDGYPVHAPVGSFAPNAFGLHDVLGNVREWCNEIYVPMPERSDLDDQGRPRIARRRIPNRTPRMVRGGGWFRDADGARIIQRSSLNANESAADLGIRPVKRLRTDEGG